ncbi:secreted protein [Streptomyces davaonensis JCM 4913]|uniref:Secreted protein n=1 Tax=Streptomyces davaonensis (strain DSM 101723 / JCM 4913 / KCC S-0913 / 768) TaxID=1214101 RepID=K4R878_STRDJ|nr:transglycosylase family protein [Streptomyces davaonensis]CCK29563.1 secreted protein [Streptomyces davaonensis JCM 4913]
MLSGNGRHRRPRQAPALIVAAGVTGSAIAIPLLGASGASAAEGTAWDRVAECESGGYWSEDSGNGYYGGLQVTQENWERYGGTTYAESADQASRSQQIAVAERILADQGLAAWPTCGPLSGLDEESGSVDLDTGVAGDESASSGDSGSSGLLDSIDGDEDSDEQGNSPSEESDNSTKSDKSSKSPESEESEDPRESAESSQSSGSSESPDGDPSQEVDSKPTATPGRDNSDNIGQNDGDSALTDTGANGTGRHRGEPADEGVTDGSYVVRDGDSLTGIADSLDLNGGWRGLYAANKSTVGTDPDLILPGQTLEVGVEPGEKQR